jgi:hypothetical protein
MALFWSVLEYLEIRPAVDGKSIAGLQLQVINLAKIW